MARKLIGRSNVPAPASYGARRGVTASAARINLRDRNETQELSAQSTRSKWQEDAWRVSDAIGEIKFAYGLVASVMSRLRLYPAYVADPDSAPIPLTDAAEVERPEDEEEGADGKQVYHREVGLTPQQALEVRDLYRKQMINSSIPGILRSFALNINIPGEGYLLLHNNEWAFKSTSEIKVQTDGVHQTRSQGSMPKKLPDDLTIGRVWREHPQFSYEADSSLRALIDDCDELLLLSKVIRTNSRARLNAGILFIPDEIVSAKRTESDDPELEAEEEVDLEKELYEALTAGVANEDAANTVMPLLFRGPGELGDQIKHIKLERVIDEFLVNRADRTLERILQGLDVPKDLVTGLANVKYSNAIQIDESLYKAHIEPLALVICDAFTDIILRPILKARLAADDGSESGWTEELISKIVIWYDPSEVVTRPDRAADALALYNAKELSGTALRAAHSFTDNDAPDEAELARRLAVEGQVPEAVMQVLLQSVLPTVLKRLAASEGGLPGSLEDTLGGGGGEELSEPGLDPTIPEGAVMPEPSAPSAPAQPSSPTQAAPAAPSQPTAPPVPAEA